MLSSQVVDYLALHPSRLGSQMHEPSPSCSSYSFSSSASSPGLSWESVWSFVRSFPMDGSRKGYLRRSPNSSPAQSVTNIEHDVSIMCALFPHLLSSDHGSCCRCIPSRLSPAFCVTCILFFNLKQSRVLCSPSSIGAFYDLTAKGTRMSRRKWQIV